MKIINSILEKNTLFSSRTGFGNKQGFTLVETIVVVAIAALLFSIAIFSISSIRNTNSLQKNAVDSVAFIEEARSLSISGKGDSVYGVQIKSNGIIMFIGTSSAQYKTLTFDANTSSIDNISLHGGGSTILFQKITGATNNYGSFRIKTIANTNSSTTVSIAGTGVVSKK